MQKNWKTLPLICLLALGLTHCTVQRPTSTDSTTKGASKEDLFRKEVISYAEKQLGSKYKYAGRDPKGFDCSGFTYYVLHNFGVSVSTSSRAQEKEGRGIPVKSAKPGDLIFFRRSPVGQVFHVAMVVSISGGDLRVIHSTSRGVVIDNILESSYWKPKISTARDVISEKY